jgi:membrane protein required for colicin V production
MQLATLDWIFLAVLLASMVLGAWRGLVSEVLSLMGWVAGFFLAQWFAPDVARVLPMAGAGEQMRYAAGFLLVFIAAVFGFGLMAFLVSKLVASVGLRPIDRVLGAGFGILRGLLLLLAATVVVGMTPLKNSAEWSASKGAHAAGVALAALKPMLPQDFGKYLHS